MESWVRTFPLISLRSWSSLASPLTLGNWRVHHLRKRHGQLRWRPPGALWCWSTILAKQVAQANPHSLRLRSSTPSSGSLCHIPIGWERKPSSTTTQSKLGCWQTSSSVWWARHTQSPHTWLQLYNCTSEKRHHSLNPSWLLCLSSFNSSHFLPQYQLKSWQPISFQGKRWTIPWLWGKQSQKQHRRRSSPPNLSLQGALTTQGRVATISPPRAPSRILHWPPAPSNLSLRHPPLRNSTSSLFPSVLGGTLHTT